MEDFQIKVRWIKRSIGVLAIILAFLILNNIQSYNLPNIVIQVVTAASNFSTTSSNSTIEPLHAVRVIVRVLKVSNHELHPLQYFQVTAYRVTFLENTNESILVPFSSRLTNRYGYAIFLLPAGDYILTAVQQHHHIDNVRIKLNMSDKEILVNLMIYEDIVKPSLLRFYDKYGEEGVIEFGDHLEVWYPSFGLQKPQLILLNFNKVEIKMFIKELAELGNISHISLSPATPLPLSEIRNLDFTLSFYRYKVEVLKRG
ncbi:MAG: hypothetical protein RMJ31_05015 [Nitrososphaerota archaeon]|nr:hypothetical protein [Nitrososphaerales archaeon]MDW8045117.1 hypothetical protein [Nitrososphaerota archaeon]